MEQGAGRHTANISGNGMTKSTDSKSVTNGNGIVTLLDELSKSMERTSTKSHCLTC